MRQELHEEYRQGLRRLLLESGQVVKLREREVSRWPDDPSMWVSAYGWEDYDASAHVRVPTEQERAWWPDTVDDHYHACPLIIPEGATLEEVTYAEDAGTGDMGHDVMGLNAHGGPEGAATEIRCSCGRFRGLTVRWTGSMQDALAEVLGVPSRVRYTL